MIRWLLDLIFAALLTVMAGAAILTLDGLLRIAVVLPVILFVPGYAFLSMLFPEGSRLSGSRSRSRSRNSGRTWGRQTNQSEETDTAFLLNNIERLGLSLGLSLALVALIIFGLNFTVGFSTKRIAAMLFGFTVAMIIFAIARRIVLPPEERYVIEFSLNDLPMDTRFMGMFAVSLLILTASVGLFAVQSPASKPYTGFTIVAQNESTGNTTLEAADNAIVNGEPVTIRVDNGAAETQTYTVVVALETLENGEVTDTEVIERLTTTVDSGALKRIEYDPPNDGADRIVFYLYRGEAPENLSRESAYATLRYFLTTNAQDGEDEQESIASPSLFGQQPIPAGSR